MLTPDQQREISTQVRQILEEYARAPAGAPGLRTLGTGSNQAAPGSGSGSYVPNSRTISTTAPLSGGGALSSNLTLTTSMATNKLIGRSTAGTGVMEEIAVGTGLSLSAGTLSATASSAGIPPIGSIICWTTATPPTGWISADGSSLLRAGTYAALFAVIGTTFGAADGTHFTLPNPTILVASTLWVIRYA